MPWQKGERSKNSEMVMKSQATVKQQLTLSKPKGKAQDLGSKSHRKWKVVGTLAKERHQET